MCAGPRNVTDHRHVVDGQCSQRSVGLASALGARFELHCSAELYNVVNRLSLSNFERCWNTTVNVTRSLAIILFILFYLFKSKRTKRPLTLQRGTLQNINEERRLNDK